MHFRPCIDIHNGKVKQIVGGSLTDQGNQAKENFTASENAGLLCKNVSERRTYRGTCDTFKSGIFRIL